MKPATEKPETRPIKNPRQITVMVQKAVTFEVTEEDYARLTSTPQNEEEYSAFRILYEGYANKAAWKLDTPDDWTYTPDRPGIRAILDSRGNIIVEA